MIAIIDYGVGNLFSLSSSLRYVGAQSVVTGDAAVIAAADRLILPGVGAFGDAAKKLRDCGLDTVLCGEAKKGKLIMGVCLGMQLLFEQSSEFGSHRGLGLIPGRIEPLAADTAPGLKVPQMGWNRLEILRDDPLLKDFPRGACVYYVHSYYAKDCEPYVIAQSEYGVSVPGVVRNGSVYGCQFHPEKSGDAGLSILRAFAGLPL